MGSLTMLQVYFAVSMLFVVFLVVQRLWVLRKMRLGQHGTVFGTKLQSDTLAAVERQTKALERIADALDAQRTHAG